MCLPTLPSWFSHLKVLISCAGQVAPLVGEVSLYTKKVAGLIPGQGSYLGGRFNPWLGYVWEATDFVSVSLMCSLPLSLPLSLSLSLSLSSINTSSGEGFKKVLISFFIKKNKTMYLRFLVKSRINIVKIPNMVANTNNYHKEPQPNTIAFDTNNNNNICLLSSYYLQNSLLKPLYGLTYIILNITP